MSQTRDAEKRRFHRITFQGAAFLSCDGEAQRVVLENLSLHGALVRVAGNDCVPSPGQICALRVPLGPELDILLETRVARVQGEEVGLAVERLDLESAAHLKRLVELHLGDSTLLNLDLDALFRR